MTYSEIIKKYLPEGVVAEKHTNVIVFKINPDQLVKVCRELYYVHKLRLKLIRAADERKESGVFKIFYVFGLPHEEFFLAPYIELKDTFEFPSLAREIFESSLYEREIHSFFGLTPIGHPYMRVFILHENWETKLFPLRKDFNGTMRPKMVNGTYEFQKVAGEGIYEIPVGPVHAGVIEPGHFRFSVAGEEIVALEPKLGYVHKGTEKLFETLPLAEKLRLSERVSGDTSFTHSLAFCQAVEKLAGITVPPRALHLRVIYSELERLANHLNDVGFILNDTAFSFGGSNGTRLKERVMQLCEQFTGSRFLRGVNTFGGVAKDISDEELKGLVKELAVIKEDFDEVVAITEDNETVLNRLKGTGVLDKQIAIDHGVGGIAARAVGLSYDSRLEYPYAAYGDLHFKLVKQTTGDVYARYRVRIEEIGESIDLISEAVKKMPVGSIRSSAKVELAKSAVAVSVTEGWRGEIVYFVATDSTGEISRVGVRDVSFLNWPAVQYAVVGNVVPDFPLINKSFNLSYSGFDR
jgi:Ni,Fe-hydrogenase III large subunit/Ni,Fe-hydrogenase III component G